MPPHRALQGASEAYQLATVVQEAGGVQPEADTAHQQNEAGRQPEHHNEHQQEPAVEGAAAA